MGAGGFSSARPRFPLFPLCFERNRTDETGTRSDRINGECDRPPMRTCRLGKQPASGAFPATELETSSPVHAHCNSEPTRVPFQPCQPIGPAESAGFANPIFLSAAWMAARPLFSLLLLCSNLEFLIRNPLESSIQNRSNSLIRCSNSDCKYFFQKNVNFFQLFQKVPNL